MSAIWRSAACCHGFRWPRTGLPTMGSLIGMSIPCGAGDGAGGRPRQGPAGSGRHQKCFTIQNFFKGAQWVSLASVETSYDVKVDMLARCLVSAGLIYLSGPSCVHIVAVATLAFNRAPAFTVAPS
eukprot:5481226-Pyramimonas_sp.AAC.1